jgi:predicted Zn-dependent protease
MEPVMRSLIAALILVPVLATPAAAQLGGLGKALGKAREVQQELSFTDAEEQALGAEISAKIRDKYGVVQDQAVHKYVALVGTVLASRSARPGLKWTFVVLDTDGVNAFAAPGGFIHITRGALALLQNEAELASVLGHEIGHVTAKHTLNAIQKSKTLGLAAQASRQQVISRVATRGYELLLENNFDRNDEMSADRIGATLANGAGYSPDGLNGFLTRLAERNKGLTERSGVFASHPETRARLEALARVIKSDRLTATATVQPRYAAAIPFKPVPVTSVAQVAPPASAAAPTSGGSGGGFGLSNLGALGRERSSAQTVSSGGSRGVNPDRDAAGGPNRAAVAVTITLAELAEFRKGITA